MKYRSKLSRREFLKLLKAGAINLALLGLGGTAYGFLVEPGRVKIESVRLNLKRLPLSFSGIRIVQISDIHMGGWMNAERLQDILDLVVAQKPDLVLITGDFLLGRGFNENSQQSIRDLVDVLSPLTELIPVFAVLGNHDYWTSADAVREMLRACRITDLTNTFFTLARGDEGLHLCGVDDIWEGDPRLQDVLDGLPDDSAAILLAHEPDFAEVSAATGRFDLQVSGHTHGGQVVIPFYGPPILPHLGRRFPGGLHKIGDLYLYTNRGVGTGRLPVRFNCPPEITVFELTSGEDK